MSSGSTGSIPCNTRIRGRSIFPIQRGHSLVQREDGGEVKRAEVGVDLTKISGHNFQIGAVTTASEKGIQD